MPFHFFVFDGYDFAFQIFDDVVKVFPVDSEGTLYTKKFTEIKSLDNAELLKAANQLLNEGN